MKRAVIALAAVAGAFALAPLANATPVPVKAYYMYGSTLGSLEYNAYTNAKVYAANQPSGTTRVLMLDFGAARKVNSSTWGAVDFSGKLFANGDILYALKSAADGYHNGGSSGHVLIAYGNSNYHMSQAGMGTSAAWYAGYYQSDRAKQLAQYQASKGYTRQSAAAGSDMEPSWDGPLITRQLVNGDYGHGWALYYDFGSADGCPSSGSSGSCNNGWNISDVAYVSYYGLAWGLPEIYYTVNADQWTVARRNWNAQHSSSYTFAGVTGEAGAGLRPQDSWNALAARNSGLVANELICFC